MTIGELARKSGLSVRTLRFYADAGVLPEAGRSKAGYRLFDNDAVPRARLIRTLRDLGVGLGDVKRVVGGEASLADVASAHARALDTQIRALRLQRAVLAAVAGTTNPKELERMNDLTSMTSEQRRRLLDDYLDAVFDGDPSPVAERIRMGAPELPDDPTVDQIAAWVEIAELLRDPEFVAVSRRMAERARLDGAGPDGGQVPVDGVAEHAGAAARAEVDPNSAEARAVLERIEALVPAVAVDHTALAERIETFTDRRVLRYWELVAVVNGWERASMPAAPSVEAWEWYAQALRANP